MSASSFVADQYLYLSVNCLSSRAVSFTEKAINLNKELERIKDSVVKVGFPLKRFQGL